MSITTKQVKHIGELARLGLTGKELKNFKGELSSVLEFIDKLNEVKTDKIEPVKQIAGLSNVLRQDKGSESSKTEADKLLKSAPSLKNGYFKVKAVL